jgi:hypothetical protein
MVDKDKKNYMLLSEIERQEYVDEFWQTVEPIIENRVLRRRGLKTKYKIKELPTIEKFQLRKEYEIKAGKRSLNFVVTVKPWLWRDGSILVELKFLSSKNLVIPRRKLERMKIRPRVWKPGENAFWLIETMEPIASYLKAVEMTPVDVSLFDTLETAFDQMLGKVK